MSILEHELENVLRAAPKPAPPVGLKERLLAEIPLPVPRRVGPTAARGAAPTGWFRRWWPVLVPTAASVACAVGLALQQVEICALKATLQGSSPASGPAVLPMPLPQTNQVPSGPDAAVRTRQEVERLKAQAGQLTAELAQLEPLRAENSRLRAQLAQPPGFLTPEESAVLTRARERGESIKCYDNLKQLSVAIRRWAGDHGGKYPPNLLELSKSMATPQRLVCPGDHAREAAKDWTSYTTTNCSYEYWVVAAPQKEPSLVVFRCPIHGHLCLADGNVEGDVGKTHPDYLVQRGGKLYREDYDPNKRISPAAWDQ